MRYAVANAPLRDRTVSLWRYGCDMSKERYLIAQYDFLPMTLNPKAVQKVSNSLFLVLILLEVFLALLYLADIFVNGKAYQLFDMDGLITIPSLLQALQLYIIGLISLGLFIVHNPETQRPSKLFLFTFASLFIYASVDELLEIHQQLPNLLHTPYNYEWMLIYISIGLITLLGFYRDFIALWDFHRRSLLLMAVGIVLIVIGGLGTEIFKYELLQPLLGQIFQQGELVAILVEKLRVAVEEFLEMLGESITIYGICLYVTKRLEEEPSSAIAPSPQPEAIAPSSLPEAIAKN